ncbi:peptide-methionine (S)-S-oxide reductase MsrA [Craterilacuibacter sp. RT1T]|uniref:peptide-methionine (S)-S-oxide reductase MsrA n=1 Tax=Craterilacuibacter sp. RT1T TaxID=2942211 RepID=UPI0020BDABE2|nr:peptide-methionine (S)-S-oxide reductase MsrA [Craterilacuibacter sp. RT1T]MCL6263086.1 peptide-methionine (S)-S-oxide reductase MsrA [Craterilacuibacter sp. RT1T]
MAIAILAGGCFWCTEAVFSCLKGVTQVEPGYIGGHTSKPDYAQVCSGHTGHAEAVRIHFDEHILPFSVLLDIFFASHDPTQLNRQGNDIGSQYRSAIFAQDAKQALIAHERMRYAQQTCYIGTPIVTLVEPAQAFWPAEAAHHAYYARHGDAPYCQAVIQPKLAKIFRLYADKLARD